MEEIWQSGARALAGIWQYWAMVVIGMLAYRLGWSVAVRAPLKRIERMKAEWEKRMQRVDLTQKRADAQLQRLTADVKAREAATELPTSDHLAKVYSGKDAEIERDQDQAEKAQESLVERLGAAITRLSWARRRAESWHTDDAVGAIDEVLTTLKAIVGERQKDTAEEAIGREHEGATWRTGSFPLEPLPTGEGRWASVYDAKRRKWTWVPCKENIYPDEPNES